MTVPNPLVRVVEWLNRPLFGTKIIPRDAAVPPGAFPEDEFPVYCPKCDYELRGLPDGRCPECGEAFDRGRLLVEQYVREHDHRVWERGRLGRWAQRLASVVLIALLVWIVATHVAWWTGPLIQRFVKPTAQQADRMIGLLQIVHQIMWWGQLFMLAALLGCVAILLRLARRNARKRRTVLDAIPE